MKASDIMRRPVVAATPTATARDVAIQLLMGEFSGVPIAQSDGSVVGIVTELDLIRAVLRAGKALETTLAQDIMTRDVTTVDGETPMEDVMRVLEERHHPGPGDRPGQARGGHLAVRHSEGDDRTSSYGSPEVVAGRSDDCPRVADEKSYPSHRQRISWRRSVHRLHMRSLIQGRGSGSSPYVGTRMAASAASIEPL